jgi:glutamate--cysteine ligase
VDAEGRYRIMGEYMPKRGKLGLDMMLRTCTVQANLDYQSEADMVRKFRVSLALQPSRWRCSPIRLS